MTISPNRVAQLSGASIAVSLSSFPSERSLAALAVSAVSFRLALDHWRFKYILHCFNAWSCEAMLFMSSFVTPFFVSKQ